jgi:hypothetical protein
MEKYAPHILELLDVEGFIRQYWMFIQDYETYEQAYNATERLYKKFFGKNKYSSFTSFKRTYYRHLKSGKV